MTLHQRLTDLRATIAAAGIDGFLLSTGDEHNTEFVAPYAKRLAWLTGFTGSSASAVVLMREAAIFVDGRYTAAVREMVDGADWSYQNVPQTSPGEWLAVHAAKGARIGYDPRLHTRTVIQTIEQKLEGCGVSLVPLATNPIDSSWADQPARPATAMFVLPIEMAGKSSADKRRDISEWLTQIGADACVLVALDSIAWLFNLRGRDIDVTPVNLSFAICHKDGTADLFVDRVKVSEAVAQHLGRDVRIAPYESFLEALSGMGGQCVSVDPVRSPVAIAAALEEGGAKVRYDRDPTSLAKAIKNPTEIEGFRQCHIRDGAALTRFLHWLCVEAPKGTLTELSAAAKLNAIRQETKGFHSVSFHPISAADAHGAIPHYLPTEASNFPIKPDSIYLIDSGGQYRDGTTDVTRTVAIGRAPAEVKDRFTRVLKGHIALDTTVFPAGTFGSQLDTIARLALWRAGIDYGHGTGHGVGHFLAVHEGPAHILNLHFDVKRPGEAPIEAGMVLSNEPAYYKEGHYGIRIENLVTVVERPIPGAEKRVLGFEALTMAPIDRNLVDTSLLTDAEIDWVNGYHATVRERLGPLLPDDTRAWLSEQTAPLRRGSMS